MLVEARATGYVYHASNDRLELHAAGKAAGAAGASPPRGEGGKTEKANLLLDAKKKLVGVDLRGTSAAVVLMLGAHEDVDGQAEASVRVELGPDGELAAVTIEAASKSIESPAKNAY